VDGDGYIFREQLVKKGLEGGVDAAQFLLQEVKNCLSRLDSDADRCRIMVRVYANLKGLSKALALAGGQAGLEARSLAPFTSSFTRSQELFDFVDAGDKKEGVEFKIRGKSHVQSPEACLMVVETFRLFVESSQCKHIFFAGCHDTSYLSILTPYKNNLDRVTLIKSAGFINDFKSLALRIEEFPSVFRSTPLDGYTNGNKTHIVNKPPVPTGPNGAHQEVKATCVFFVKVTILSISIRTILTISGTLYLRAKLSKRPHWNRWTRCQGELCHKGNSNEW
jgi:hypothetical protein